MARDHPPGSRYVSPLVTRNASDTMAGIFSARRRAVAFRRVWLALAQAQHELGLPVSRGQVRALREGLDRVNLAAIARHERRTRHDLMAHLHAYADIAPSARPILHLGATSMDVVDNADLCIVRDALTLVRDWLHNVVLALADLALAHRDLPCLGWTHYQPAQLTTLGKRAALWCWDSVCDLNEIDRLLTGLSFRGIRGATGTQASFMQLSGSAPAVGAKARRRGASASEKPSSTAAWARVTELERRVASQLGFTSIEPVTGQTYSRKHDARIMSALAGIAASVHKFANDIRLMCNLREVAEPFERGQVGSSAMPYKRNPMLSERATGLARFVICLSQSAWQTAAEQWLERTLDDSSNKRIIVPEAFLAVDGMLQIVLHIARGLIVYPRVIAARVRGELPFMATESVLMSAVASGADRQELHEKLRRHSHAAASQVFEQGNVNDLLDRLQRDPAFAGVDWVVALDLHHHVGAAPQQVDALLRDVIAPLRRRFRSIPRLTPRLSV